MLNRLISYLFILFLTQSASVLAQEVESLSIPIECGNDDAKYCLLGSYRSNLTITLLPDGNELSCRVNTGKQTVVTIGKKKYSATTLVNNRSNCNKATSYRVAVAGPVDSYRRAQVEASSSTDNMSSIKEHLAKRSEVSIDAVESLEIFNFEKNLFEYDLIKVKVRNSKRSPLYAYQDNKLTLLANGCFESARGVIVESKVYLVIHARACGPNTGGERIGKVYRFTQEGSPMEVYSDKFFIKK